MERRDFLTGLLATAVAPVLPSVVVDGAAKSIEDFKVVCGTPVYDWSMCRYYFWAANDGWRAIDDKDMVRGDFSSKPVSPNSDAEAYVEQFMADVKTDLEARLAC